MGSGHNSQLYDSAEILTISSVYTVESCVHGFGNMEKEQNRSVIDRAQIEAAQDC